MERYLDDALSDPILFASNIIDGDLLGHVKGIECVSNGFSQRFPFMAISFLLRCNGFNDYHKKFDNHYSAQLQAERDTLLKILEYSFSSEGSIRKKYGCMKEEPSLPKEFHIKLKNSIIKMELVLGDNDNGTESFYISDTPITMEQYCDVSNAPSDFLNYLAEYYSSRYKDCTIAPAFTVECVMKFFDSWTIPLPISLPSREQWLYLVLNSYDTVKWYDASKYIGVSDSNRIEWEVISYHSNDIYCLLGVNEDEGEIKISGNNFPKGKQRDNIAFRIVCTAENAIQFIKTYI